ncbi:MAG: hypothetical protein A2Y40_04860 [Candidatus Margulisbacteria bacterium GWF2_35_9]|nr:MAG: hypothetical protein A2Y40_04860 [Candidatus Margulisbacteria bacterium GWF2_35_9]
MLFSKLNMPMTTVSGKGEIFSLLSGTAAFGNGLIVHGSSLRKKPQFKQLTAAFKRKSYFYPYEGGEPTLENVREVIEYAKRKKSLWIGGIGGGSVMDLAKAAAGLYKTSRDPEYYQNGGVVEKKGIPFVAVPTTAGSGAEATINAVINNEKTNEKLSIRDDYFMADLIILDPDLMIGITPTIVAQSGLDAITQAIESFISNGANWYTQNLALKGFELLIHNIECLFDAANQKEDSASYEKMLLGSYLTGIAFTNSRLGVIHGLAHSLGAIYKQPHGLVCALCLVPALEINKNSISEQYKKLSDIAGMDLINRINLLIEKFEIQNVFKNLELKDPKKMIANTLASGSTKANPKTITEEDVRSVLKRLF